MEFAAYYHTDILPQAQSSVKVQSLLEERTWASIMKTVIQQSRNPPLTKNIMTARFSCILIMPMSTRSF